ncbi:cell wall hydrolase [Oscillibacter sp. MSJ-2]|uniref:Cell wall hydrolase n=1 Tax=Dysosmobacter acutus TaxID=2841504 RepID=A0ABS6FDD8_9FIRM|nr:cell wall hydrolase [Dysosmobacter acutus]MBU5627641.1 cell wall hydrolase [Dysosmobacter acutus]
MMRTLLCGFAAAALLTGTASAMERVDVQVDDSRVSGYFSQGTTYVSLREALDALGGWEVSWDSASRSAVASSGGSRLSAPIGSGTVTLNGSRYVSTAQTFLTQGRTYVPARLLAAACGTSVAWSGDGAVLKSQDSSQYTEEDLYWLSRIISAESQGEPLEGQIAVGNVVLNRVASDQFPNTIREVVFDTKNGVQFEPLSNGTLYNAPTAQSVAAARLVLSGSSTAGGSLYFFAPALSQGTWIRQNRTYLKTIGCHQFYL